MQREQLGANNRYSNRLVNAILIEEKLQEREEKAEANYLEKVVVGSSTMATKVAGHYKLLFILPETNI